MKNIFTYTAVAARVIMKVIIIIFCAAAAFFMPKAAAEAVNGAESADELTPGAITRQA